ncbi:MAG: patatin-like phospholipase family protein [Rubrivivax sp.]
MPAIRRTTDGRRAPQPTAPQTALPTIPKKAPPIDLALQGGGSHGAFTWGVLDRLLEEPWLAFDGVSGTSAGALNAAVLATGMAAGGRPRAQAALREFWEDVAAAGAPFGSAQGGLLAPLPLLPGVGLPGFPPFGREALAQWMAELTRYASPYQFNPLDINPLRQIVRRHVDIAAVSRGKLAVFVNATAVTTGRPRIFRREDLSHDALLASACLPQLFRAVEIDGVPYWDGGYSGNPALWPLIYETPALDIVLVKIDPLERAGTPDTPLEIQDRINEINFNSGLVGEMRAIAFVQKLHREGRVRRGEYKDLRMHMVADETAMTAMTASSKLDTGIAFLRELHDQGHAAATAWLKRDARWLGRRSTLDVRRTFLGEDGAEAPAVNVARKAVGKAAAKGAAKGTQKGPQTAARRPRSAPRRRARRRAAQA